MDNTRLQEWDILASVSHLEFYSVLTGDVFYQVVLSQVDLSSAHIPALDLVQGGLAAAQV